MGAVEKLLYRRKLALFPQFRVLNQGNAGLCPFATVRPSIRTRLQRHKAPKVDQTYPSHGALNPLGFRVLGP